MNVSARRILKTASSQKAFVAVLVMYFGMLFSGTRFYTAYNQLDILNSASINLIIAAGVTLTIICGGCDLSVGSVMSLSGIIAIKLMEWMPIPVAILCAIGFGALVGFVNGFLVVNQKTEPFIITLGMGMAIRGFALQITGGAPISRKGMDFAMLANTYLGRVVPILVLYMLVIMVLMHCVLRYTGFGRNCYAIGGDYYVAVYSGIHAARIKWSTFVISGAMAALGGVLLSSKMNSGSAVYGDATALLINCGAVVGGTSFAGGKGGIPQTFIGLVALAVLQNCMNMLQITSYVQQVFQGIVIVGIIWLDCFGIKRKREAV